MTRAKSPLHERAKAMFYGPDSTRQEVGGTISHAVESYVMRRVNRFNDSNDPENVLKARQEGVRIRGWAERHNISPTDLQAALGAQLDHESRLEHRRMLERMGKEKPFTKEEQDQQRAKRTADVLETMRLECGSEEAAQAMARRYVAMTTTLAEELPELTIRANENGAAEDFRIVRALSNYEPVVPAKE